ncbi:hypothetical protein AAG747_12380 [Rapidithrix thailandica]|uniref:Uncharacterized protein n=1 Tax=Rapidithrix thailandica TaxID=413964 RepID=A0AAW9RUY8_9BACT
MEYMGFGMDKEAYSRKPRESFKKFKELYGNDKLNIKRNKIADSKEFGSYELIRTAQEVKESKNLTLVTENTYLQRIK